MAIDVPEGDDPRAATKVYLDLARSIQRNVRPLNLYPVLALREIRGSDSEVIFSGDRSRDPSCVFLIEPDEAATRWDGSGTERSVI